MSKSINMYSDSELAKKYDLRPCRIVLPTRFLSRERIPNEEPIYPLRNSEERDSSPEPIHQFKTPDDNYGDKTLNSDLTSTSVFNEEATRSIRKSEERDSSSKSDSGSELEDILIPQFTSIDSNNGSNHSNMDSDLAKKFRLKPCSIVLERNFRTSKAVSNDLTLLSQHSSEDSSKSDSETSSDSEASSDSDYSISNKHDSTLKKKTFSIKKKMLPSYKRTKCKLCGEISESRSAFAYHMKFNHPEVKLYACTYTKCEESFSKMIQLKNHLKGHYLYVCRFCKQRYVRKYHMREHVKNSHKNQK